MLPGLIDCHTHLEARADRYDPIWDVKETPFDGGFNGVLNANKTLLAESTQRTAISSSQSLSSRSICGGQSMQAISRDRA